MYFVPVLIRSGEETYGQTQLLLLATGNNVSYNHSVRMSQMRFYKSSPIQITKNVHTGIDVENGRGDSERGPHRIGADPGKELLNVKAGHIAGLQEPHQVSPINLQSRQRCTTAYISYSMSCLERVEAMIVTRKEFRRPSDAALEGRIAEAEETAQFLRRNFVQAERTGENHYSMNLINICSN